MSDIFDKITNSFINRKADRTVQVNTGYVQGLDFYGPGNYTDIIDDLDDEFYQDFEGFEREANEYEAEEYEAEMDLSARLPSREHNPDSVVDKAWKEHLEKNPEMKEYVGKIQDVKEEMGKTAGAGAENAKYLSSISPQKKMEILNHIAKHYGVSVHEIEEEVTDSDAEKLFEYAATNRSMAMEILRGMSRMATEYDLGRRLANHDSHSGSYMSLQNLEEMQDALQVVADMVHEGEELDDWVEDKISHAHQLIRDLAGYFGYGQGYHEHNNDFDY